MSRRYVRAGRTLWTPWFTWVCKHPDHFDVGGQAKEEHHATLGNAIEAGRRHWITEHAIPERREQVRRELNIR